jgi:tubulin monoglycylase TTLL15
MMRFDLVVDNNLKVTLMEANMSPNLSSAHYKPNQLLYEQVIYHLLGLVGVGSMLDRQSFRKLPADTERMVSADKNIVVDAVTCGELPCSETCAPVKCSLCLPCLSRADKEELHQAFREHVNRGETKRIFPPRIVEVEEFDEEYFYKLSPRNQWMAKWFYEKCRMDDTWC